MWSEIADAKEAILKQLDSLRDTKSREWHDRFVKVDEFLRSDSVKRIEYTPAIMCRTRIRLMRGAKPHKDQDAAIIESLAAFFEGTPDEHPVLLFCSENHTDFAIELQPGGDRNRRFAIDPEIASVLPVTHYALRLNDLLQMNRGYESLPKPPESGEIAQAIGKMSELENEWDYDGDEYVAAFAEVVAFNEKRLSQDFTANVLPTIPEELRSRRREACDRIASILRECRQCLSWDDRSEYKLSQWLESVPEHMIPYTSLARILRIEDSVKRYLHIHKSMDEERQT